MSQRDRDLTPIIDHVARTQHNRARAVLDDEHRAECPEFDHLSPVVQHSIKQHLLTVVLDVLDALDAQDQQAAETDVLAALEAQFGDPEDHSPEADS